MPTPSSSPTRSHSPPSLRRSSRSSSTSRTSETTASGSSYFTFPVTYSVNGLLRRLSGDTPSASGQSTPSNMSKSLSSSMHWPHNSQRKKDSLSHSSYTPAPARTASPFQPPPLTPLTLTGYRSNTTDEAKILSRSLAEEIRLLIPPRLQLVEQWSLVFSLEQDGVSLATLYKKCEEYRGTRGGFVLVVKDAGGGIFGAFLTEAPHPAPHFFGTGECFLWRAHILPPIPDMSSLPLPPSADTTDMSRMTTLSGQHGDGSHSPDRIRFKAFPYSGINDYLMFCESGFLSVGGGDGHYGLWLDDNLETGVSSRCVTFGNEPLSDEGTKFDVLGVEIWYIGA
ncbi:TLD-domain-containing protein [Microthyrium microscopicum]|uniref:Oxidation resistance protein 1 n=1 Tax=Microthyrium microscopicum TaxID=703497 RepID=A0A6A6TW63_9PEZI|nr:TLD-domain-containing protein [Microthyrium microscopicum]